MGGGWYTGKLARQTGVVGVSVRGQPVNSLPAISKDGPTMLWLSVTKRVLRPGLERPSASSQYRMRLDPAGLDSIDRPARRWISVIFAANGLAQLVLFRAPLACFVLLLILFALVPPIPCQLLVFPRLNRFLRSPFCTFSYPLPTGSPFLIREPPLTVFMM